ncbi:MAG TPA: ATP-dependent helicase [Lacunisphaera sp.]|nr:ATP-dependent helicase [Lacunisphaera sp.]
MGGIVQALVSIDKWQPSGITLEPAALEAATALSNALVVAGPGAGKTELLAQRACFLLQTGLCPPPYRILAISFKREAAENLKQRVILRTGYDLARRLDSQTYDAFGKDLLDRFRLALPAALCPSADYQIQTGPAASDESLRQELLKAPLGLCPLTGPARQSIQGRSLRSEMFVRPLPFDTWPPNQLTQAAAGIWRAMTAATPSRLQFAMINRLAEFIVRSNPPIKAALQDTYRYVFLDEFQDTTTGQCVLTETCFLGSAAVLTAVGDTKQRIMGWAGALSGVFKRFEDTFDASVVRLTQNHRSRSRLVKVQSVFAQELDDESVEAVTARPGQEPGECRLLEFASADTEGVYLAKLIQELLAVRKIPAEEICVLCRARPDSFAAKLIASLLATGIKVSVEVSRRDTIAEPVSTLLLGMLELIVSDAAPDAWEHVTAVMGEVRGDLTDEAEIKTRLELIEFLAKARENLPQIPASTEAIAAFLKVLLDFVGQVHFAAIHPQYAQGEYLTTVVGDLATLISTDLTEANWGGVVDSVRGIGAISVMTMHKSKGLEFDTVIFLGLEDGALWNYEKQSEEETCGLFVALSRAKEGCLFTFCRSRLDYKGFVRAQSRITVKRVFELFAEAKVPLEKID